MNFNIGNNARWAPINWTFAIFVWGSPCAEIHVWPSLKFPIILFFKQSSRLSWQAFKFPLHRRRSGGLSDQLYNYTFISPLMISPLPPSSNYHIFLPQLIQMHQKIAQDNLRHNGPRLLSQWSGSVVPLVIFLSLYSWVRINIQHYNIMSCSLPSKLLIEWCRSGSFRLI